MTTLNASYLELLTIALGRFLSVPGTVIFSSMPGTDPDVLLLISFPTLRLYWLKLMLKT